MCVYSLWCPINNFSAGSEHYIHTHKNVHDNFTSKCLLVVNRSHCYWVPSHNRCTSACFRSLPTSSPTSSPTSCFVWVPNCVPLMCLFPVNSSSVVVWDLLNWHLLFLVPHSSVVFSFTDRILWFTVPLQRWLQEVGGQGEATQETAGEAPRGRST